MRTGSCLFLLGTLSLLQFGELPPVVLCLVLPVINVLVCLYCRFFIYCLWFTAGFCWTLAYSWFQLAHIIDPQIEGREISVSGYVSSLPVSTAHYLRFNFKVSEIQNQGLGTTSNPGLIRLYWYRPYPELKPGDPLLIKVKLKRPHGYMNPGGFDYETWLFKEGIHATGYVRARNVQIPLPEHHFDIHYYRYLLGKRLQQATDDHASVADLVHALILGDRSGIGPDKNQVLAVTGTSHLLAISGLHIGLVASFAFFTCRWMWPFWLRGFNRLPAQYAASIFSLIVALFYALLAGFTVPTQRALIMLSLVLINFLRHRKTDKSTLLAIAMLLVLLCDPLSVLAAGFWLSFLAVAIIILALNVEMMRDKYSKLRQWARVQGFIYLGLVPALALIFNQIPVISLCANIVAIPWVSLVTMPLLFFGTVLLFINSWLASIVMEWGLVSLDILWNYLDYLANMDFGPLILAQPTMFAIISSSIGIGIVLLPKAMPCKFLGFLWLLPLLLPATKTPQFGDFDLAVLDVGQGLAVVIRTQHRLLLYDTGPGSMSGFNAGSAVIIPYLRFSGDKLIDKIIQSHGDNDHIGGLSDIIRNMPVTTILTSVPAQTEFISTRYCRAGQSWNWDGVSFKVLHPDESSRFSGNNASCVLKIGNGENAVLLTGDIERRAETQLWDSKPLDLRSRVLVAPHHGSKTSSSPEFMRAVSAETVVISSGYLNRFRLPNQDIIKRYRSSGARIYNTATDGAISIRFREGEFLVGTERQRSSKFWHFKL